MINRLTLSVFFAGLISGYLLHGGVNWLFPSTVEELSSKPSEKIGTQSDVKPKTAPVASGNAKNIDNSADQIHSLPMNPDLLPEPLSTDEEELPEDIVTSLTKAVQSPDEKVREATLQKSIDIGVDVPQEVLMELLKSDPSDSVRTLAFIILTEVIPYDSERIKTVAEIAISDRDQSLHNRAEELLEGMKQNLNTESVQPPK